MTSVSVGHIILKPTQPVRSGRTQREPNPQPPHQVSRALPTELSQLGVTVTIRMAVVVVAVAMMFAAVSDDDDGGDGGHNIRGRSSDDGSGGGGCGDDFNIG